MYNWEYIKTIALRIKHGDEGVTAVEYGMIAALIAVAIVTSVKGVATALISEFGTIASSL